MSRTPTDFLLGGHTLRGELPDSAVHVPWWHPKRLVHCARVNTPPRKQANTVHSARRPDQPEGSSALARALRRATAPPVAEREPLLRPLHARRGERPSSARHQPASELPCSQAKGFEIRIEEGSAILITRPLTRAGSGSMQNRPPRAHGTRRQHPALPSTRPTECGGSGTHALHPSRTDHLVPSTGGLPSSDGPPFRAVAAQRERCGKPSRRSGRRPRKQQSLIPSDCHQKGRHDRVPPAERLRPRTSNGAICRHERSPIKRPFASLRWRRRSLIRHGGPHRDRGFGLAVTCPSIPIDHPAGLSLLALTLDSRFSQKETH